MRIFREDNILIVFSERSDGDLRFSDMDDFAFGQAWKEICAGTGHDLARPRFVRQVHGDAIIDLAPEGQPGSQGEADGLITAERGVPIGVFTADCLPILIAGHDRIAAIHAGWKGTRLDIAGNAVRRLSASSEQPAALRAFFGPCIGSCCLELGEEVPPTFIERDSAAASAFSHGRKWHLDLRGLNALQLMRAGIRPETLRHVHDCTRCRADRYFSYRGDHGRHGSLFSFIVRI
ncbi:MAG: peptidoglycan editing factor PgeF [Candidatus Riflebacteria bacterium]|nr:peptidoglycan editing factor PgeF [Candidatus Riflebacteria bacterium]